MESEIIKLVSFSGRQFEQVPRDFFGRGFCCNFVFVVITRKVMFFSECIDAQGCDLWI